MKRAFLFLVTVGSVLSVHAQQWAIGGAIGGGFTPQVGVTSAAGRAGTGLANGLAATAAVGQNLNRHWSGEIRYTFRGGSLLASGPIGDVRFGARSHSVHYDILIHARPAGSAIRPFAAGGAGIRVFQGTGREAAYQPLQEYVLLTKTREWKPLINAGGGIKAALSPHVWLRLEVRDYFTPFPSKVIAPATGATVKGWLHDIVPLCGISYAF